MQQGSNNWLDWRMKGIGSSDAPVIMGVSPWKTIYELWQEKAGLVVVDPMASSNWATERGNRLEPIARAKYELEFEREMGPATFQHEKYPMLRASMDGWNPQLKRGLEIKTTGLADHMAAKNEGKIPEKYWPQLMHQFLVTGAEVIDYYSYYVPKEAADHTGDGACVEVLPDLEYIKKLFAAEMAFWDCVTAKTAPNKSDDDFKCIRLIVARKAAEEWKRLAKEQEALHNQIQAVKDTLFQYGNNVRFQHTGVRINDGTIELHKERDDE